MNVDCKLTRNYRRKNAENIPVDQYVLQSFALHSGPNNTPLDRRFYYDFKARVHVKVVLTSLNTAFLTISRSRFKQR